jgi:feruloyl esterase
MLGNAVVRRVVVAGVLAAAGAEARDAQRCEGLTGFQALGLEVEITSAEWRAAGNAEPGPFGGGYGGQLPEHCRVEGDIDRRIGASGKPYAIGFAVALPADWNGRFLFQGGGGLNGSVAPPIGGTAAGETPGLVRGFAVASTDSGHQGARPFDAAFFEDQQATLNFLYQGIDKVSLAGEQIVEAFYGEPAARSYYSGCSTGGREGMIMSQRFPDRFDGIVSGAPAMRTSYSNLADRWVLVSLNAVARKDDAGNAVPGTAFSEAELKLVIDSLLAACDGSDGAEDGMISDPLGCDFDPADVVCAAEESDACLSAEQAEAVKKGLAGPVDSRGHQVYPGFLYDTGIAAARPKSFIPGLLTATGGPVGGGSNAVEMDVDAASVAAANERAAVGDSTWTNLSTFSGNGGKLIFYHGVSDPWFSALDTLGYYERMAEANGGSGAVSQWSRLFLVPGMGHCGGGDALDSFDMLGAVVEWVEEGRGPDRVVATGRAYPGRSRPLCPHPQHAHYRGAGDPELAESFECRE